MFLTFATPVGSLARHANAANFADPGNIQRFSGKSLFDLGAEIQRPLSCGKFLQNLRGQPTGLALCGTTLLTRDTAPVAIEQLGNGRYR